MAEPGHTRNPGRSERIHLEGCLELAGEPESPSDAVPEPLRYQTTDYSRRSQKIPYGQVSSGGDAQEPLRYQMPGYSRRSRKTLHAQALHVQANLVGAVREPLRYGISDDNRHNRRSLHGQMSFDAA